MKFIKRDILSRPTSIVQHIVNVKTHQAYLLAYEYINDDTYYWTICNNALDDYTVSIRHCIIWLYPLDNGTWLKQQFLEQYPYSYAVSYYKKDINKSLTQVILDGIVKVIKPDKKYFDNTINTLPYLVNSFIQEDISLENDKVKEFKQLLSQFLPDEDYLSKVLSQKLK